jgi:RND superfamily putative drug exporter
MLVFPLPFLHSFAYAGVAVVALAALGAIVLLPAIINLIGSRIEWGALPRLRKKAAERGFWYRRARWVMERPLRVVVFVTLVLLALGAPVLHLALRSSPVVVSHKAELELGHTARPAETTVTDLYRWFELAGCC